MGFFGLFKNKRSGSVDGDGMEGMTWRMIADIIKRISLTLIGGVALAWVLFWLFDLACSYQSTFYRGPYYDSWTSALLDFLSGIGCIALVLGGFGGIISLIVYLVALVVGRRITRRNMVRIWLSVSYSPLILLFLVVVGGWAYSYYGRKYEFADKERLERITGVAYPDYRIGWYLHGGHSFNGDYSDEAGIKFEEAPSADFYRCLDSLATVKGSHWSKQKDGSYSFRYIWGDGSPAPKGESDEEDRHIHIKIRKGSEWAEIEYGAW